MNRWNSTSGRRLVCATASVFCLLVGFAFSDVPNSDVVLLESFGVKSDAESLHRFFESMNPKDDVLDHTRKLLNRLGDGDFKVREKATQSLLMTPRLPIDLLTTFTQSEDPEIRWRSNHVLENAGGRSKEMLRAAMRIVATEDLTGFTKDLLDSAHFLDSLPRKKAARQAMVATVDKSDRELLRAATKSSNAETRLLATTGLVEAFGIKAIEDIRPVLEDPVDEIRLYASAEMANRGDRDSLLALTDLLTSNESPIRSRAYQLLRNFTGKNFGYTTQGLGGDRAYAAKQWRKWLETEATAADLKSGIAIEQQKLGRTLVCYYNTNQVVEYDESHKVVWETTVPQPWGCQGLPNGHRLIASYTSNAVIEYDDQGTEVWRATFEGGNPSQAQRLPNGNTLVALYSQSKVIEITPEKETVMTISVGGPPAFAERTEEGNTLVAVQGSLGAIEFDAAGKQIRNYKNRQNAFSVRKLENGNVLIADSGTNTVFEVAGDSKDVWTSNPFPNPLDAVRLENGNTLVAHSNGVVEVDKTGKQVWAESGKGQAIRISVY